VIIKKLSLVIYLSTLAGVGVLTSQGCGGASPTAGFGDGGPGSGGAQEGEGGVGVTGLGGTGGVVPGGTGGAVPGGTGGNVSCGSPGMQCCDGNACSAGGCCISGICMAAGNNCAVVGGVCNAGSCGTCGGAGQPCCGSNPTAGFCTASGMNCSSGICASCGNLGSFCCISGTGVGTCNSPGAACSNNVCISCGANGCSTSDAAIGSDAPLVGMGGKVGTGGNVGSGGAIGSSGGAIGSGGNVGTGGKVGAGGNVETGGNVGTGGKVGTGGNVGTGGAVTCTRTNDDCGARTCGAGKDNCGKSVSCGTCGTNQDCANESQCKPASLIDDFADCDASIYAMGGRRGYWFADDSASIIGEQGMGSQPPTSWGVTQCCAWMAGGKENAASDDWALLGFTINDESSYDACSYTGIEITYGSEYPVVLSFHYGSDSYADVKLSATTSTTTKRVAFPSTSVCSRLIGINIRPDGLAHFGIAIYKIGLY
jgi:hypothetical protein